MYALLHIRDVELGEQHASARLEVIEVERELVLNVLVRVAIDVAVETSAYSPRIKLHGFESITSPDEYVGRELEGFVRSCRDRLSTAIARTVVEEVRSRKP